MSKISGLFAAMEISSSGLAAQRRRMNTIAENLANTNTTRTEEGGPFKRRIVRFQEMQKTVMMHNSIRGKLALESTCAGHIQDDVEIPITRNFSGVKISTFKSQAEPEKVFNPDHPDADDEGYVKMPKIEVITEMVDMISASRAYEANVTSIKVAKDMARKALEI